MRCTRPLTYSSQPGGNENGKSRTWKAIHMETIHMETIHMEIIHLDEIDQVEAGLNVAKPSEVQ